MSQEQTQVVEATTALPQQNTPDQASSLALMLDAKSMESAMAIAEVMSKSKVTVPQHLQGQQGDCMAIVLQSMNWGMNPFAVAQKTHIVNGALGYEAQLVNAVVSSQGFIKGTFKYEYKGEGNQLECRVGAIIKGDTKITWGEWLRITDVKIQNSPLWKTNPRQQMGYLQCKNWTRLYCPAAILGVYTPDELEEIEPERVKDVTSEGSHETKPVEKETVYYTDDELNGQETDIKGYFEKHDANKVKRFLQANGKKLTDNQLEQIDIWYEEHNQPIEGEVVDEHKDFKDALEASEGDQ